MKNEQLEAALRDLTTILARERAALEAMDVAKVEALSEDKIRCLSTLESASPEDKKTMRRTDVNEVLQLARDNQRLLVHARACIRGALAALSGTSTTDGQSPAPVRLNVKG